MAVGDPDAPLRTEGLRRDGSLATGASGDPRAVLLDCGPPSRAVAAFEAVPVHVAAVSSDVAPVTPELFLAFGAVFAVGAAVGAVWCWRHVNRAFDEFEHMAVYHDGLGSSHARQECQIIADAAVPDHPSDFGQQVVVESGLARRVIADELRRRD